MGQAAKIVVGLLMVVYPVAIYFGLQSFSIQQVALLLLSIFVLRLFFMKKTQGSDQVQAGLVNTAGVFAVLIGVLLLAMVLLSENIVFLKLYPVFVNALMLLAFCWSLWNPPTAIERIARKFDPDLSPLGVRHTRQVTQVWCGFFLLNGMVAAYTCFFASLEIWTLYNGLISYVIMGIMFALEFAVRVVRMRRAGE